MAPEPSTLPPRTPAPFGPARALFAGFILRYRSRTMGYALRTEIEIAAPADRVWSVLTDFSAYPSWNPFVVSIAGDLVPAARLKVQLKAPSGPAMKIEPRVTKVDPGTRFAWRGRLPIPGLFAGEHQFEVTPLGPNKVRLVQSEQFSGMLVPLLKRMLDGSTRRGFEAMNEAVKARAEATF